MKVISAGHSYELLNSTGTRIVGTLNFVKKVDGRMMHDGTTTEEVIDVLVDRIQALNGNFPCAENDTAVASLFKAKEALEARTKDRIERGVEGKDKI